MVHRPQVCRTLLSALIAAVAPMPMAGAAPLSLAQFPAGSASRQPAPNVILTLDDSGSMAYYGEGTTMREDLSTSGMYALKSALHNLFDATTQNIPDGSIRLAWNALNRCRQFTDTSNGGCNGNNRMRRLDATHRANFLNWVGQPGTAYSSSHLGASGGTPTHQAFIAAGDYLRTASTSDQNSPWASDPYVTRDPMLSCRRSYNVLMTDGGWNWDGYSGPDVARPLGSNGDADGVRQTLPDGVVYSASPDAVTSAGAIQTRLYRQTGPNYSFTFNSTNYPISTLADLAFYYWATDLASGLSNNLKPLVRHPGTQTVGTGASAVTLQQYWNPKNNPATWQHMSTYVIGFRDAASWVMPSGQSAWPMWDSATNDTFGGSFSDLVTGAAAWPDPVAGTLGLTTLSENARKAELWHVALNGRGKFIPATSTEDLLRAFREIFGEIVNDTSTPVTSFANASASVARAATQEFTSGYEAADWKGYVYASTLAQGTGAASPAAGWGTKQVVGVRPNLTTADKLDALSASDIDQRLILSWRDTVGDSVGTLFEWASDESRLSTAQKTLLKAGNVTDTVAHQRLNFIRGDRSQEGAGMRTRGSRQGDIVNSQLWYVAQPVSNYSFDHYRDFAKTHKDRLPMVYVGGNDGMLHGFSGVDGSERIAYVPQGVVQNLHELTRTDYQHRYFVDGSPFSGDVNWGSSSTPDWRTLLVGTLGAGGKGYFVLDVTSPGSTAADASAVPSNFLKANAGTLVVMDKTAHPSVVPAAGSDAADIGHIMVPPVLEDDNAQKTTQIVRMNNGRWAVVMGNGVNSTNERPVLLVQYLDGDKSLFKLVAASSGADASGNGLSAPRLVDIDGNGTPDVVYAGDLRGNLWKFDVAAASASDWNVAFAGQPLYTAAHVAGQVSTVQPITAPPIVRANERGAGGLMVAFGTGRNLTEADRTSTAVQSIYSVLDNTRYKLVSGKVVIDTSSVTPTRIGSGVADLVQQTVGATTITGAGNSAARTFWTVSQNTVTYTGQGAQKGWYLNLPVGGERILEQMRFYDQSNNIELISEVPASGGGLAEETCSPPPTEVKKYRTLLNIMDGKRPSVQVLDTNGDGSYNAVSDQNASRMTASPTENRIRGATKEIRLGSNALKDELARMPEIPLRPNWRQLQ
jgi:type IV pilus assembly protein PilY1